MTIAYACDLNVYVCINFGDEILLRGEECKARVNLKFSEKWQNSKLMLQYGLPTYNFSRSRMTKRTLPLNSCCKI